MCSAQCGVRKHHCIPTIIHILTRYMSESHLTTQTTTLQEVIYSGKIQCIYKLSIVPERNYQCVSVCRCVCQCLCVSLYSLIKNSWRMKEKQCWATLISHSLTVIQCSPQKKKPSHPPPPIQQNRQASKAFSPLKTAGINCDMCQC